MSTVERQKIIHIKTTKLSGVATQKTTQNTPKVRKTTKLTAKQIYCRCGTTLKLHKTKCRLWNDTKNTTTANSVWHKNAHGKTNKNNILGETETMKKQNRKQGFTLVELLVVIAILAILATVSVVGYTAFIGRAHKSNALAACRSELTELQGLYTLRGGMVPDGIILSSGDYYFIVKNGVLEDAAEADVADKHAAPLQIATMYSDSNIGVGFGADGRGDTVQVISDCITLSGIGASTNNITNMTITVWNDDGVVIYSETASTWSLDWVSFDIYEDGIDPVSGNKDHLTAGAPKTAAEAYGRYYTYTVTGTQNSSSIEMSGVFYYTAHEGEVTTVSGTAA